MAFMLVMITFPVADGNYGRDQLGNGADCQKRPDARTVGDQRDIARRLAEVKVPEGMAFHCKKSQGALVYPDTECAGARTLIGFCCRW